LSNNVFRGRPISEKPQKRQAANRPESVDRIPRQVMFSTQGSTGWRRRRDISTHKGNKKEGDFSHLHEKFWGEGDESV
jgi:hypothetical protein